MICSTNVARCCQKTMLVDDCDVFGLLVLNSDGIDVQSATRACYTTLAIVPSDNGPNQGHDDSSRRMQCSIGCCCCCGMEGSGVSTGVCWDLSADAEDFIRRGPLYNHLLEPPSAWEWTSHGQALVLELTNDSVLAALSPCDLDHELAVRVYHLSLPIYFWLRQLVHQICAEKTASTRSP